MEIRLAIGIVSALFLLISRGYGRHFDNLSPSDGRQGAVIDNQETDNDDNIVSLELKQEELAANWSGWSPASGVNMDIETISKEKRRRNRRHRDSKKPKTPSRDEVKAQLKDLMRDVGSKQPEELATYDQSWLYESLIDEMETNDQLKDRLDTLEVRMNTILDMARQLSVNVSSQLRAGCQCPDTVSRQELDSIRIHQRRIYLMLNAQEERHRDVLDLIRAYRTMVYSSADVIGELEEKIQAIQSDIRVQKVKINKLNLDLHWRQIQQDVTSNDTKHLKHELGKLEKQIGALFADHGYFYTTLDIIGTNLNKSEMRSAELWTDLSSYALSLKQVLELMAAHGASYNDSVLARVGEILKNITRMMTTTNRASSMLPGTSTRVLYTDVFPCMDNICDVQLGLQRQLDETSLDVEQLKDEMAHFFTFLQAVQADIRHFRGQQDEQAILEIDIRRIKDDLIQIRRNMSRLETFLRHANDPKEVSNNTAGANPISVPFSYRTTPSVRSSIRKASRVISMVNSGEAEDLTTSDVKDTERVVVSDNPSTSLYPSGSRSQLQNEPSDMASRNEENQLDKTELVKAQTKPKNKTFDRIKQNDIVHRTHLSKMSSTEPYTTPQTKTTEQPNIEMVTYTETVSVTTTAKSLPYHNENLSYKSGLRVRPSESDVCSLPGIMIGHSTPVAKFADIQTGAWMRDPESRDNHIYVTVGHSKIKLVKEYNTTKDLVNKKAWRDFKLPIKCTGTGHVMYNGSFYCNKYKSNGIVRYDTRTNHTAMVTIKSAGYDNSFPYIAGQNTDIDFGVDEIGLWVLYSGIDHHGNIVIGKVNPETLEVYPTWETGFQKRRAVNAFMVCGRLYVVSYNSSGSLELSYVYDTLRGREIPASHQPFYSISDSVSMMAYNPKDSKLYAWVRTPQWQGQLILYGIFFIG